MMEELKYCLVLEKRRGDYNIVDINRLDIHNFNDVPNDLLAIDNFTSKFTEEEIRDSIKRSNMPQNEYIDSPLKVLGLLKSEGNNKYACKQDYDIISKKIIEVVNSFRYKEEKLEINDRNKLFGTYKKVLESTFTDRGFIQNLLERFKNILKENNKNEMFKIIEELPYNKSRII